MSTAALSLPRRRLLPGLSWVTWRQHRLALAGTFLLLAAFTVLMVVNGRAMHHAYVADGLTTCGIVTGPGCAVQLGLFEQAYQGWVSALPAFLMLLPMVIGTFLGAPVVARELESGTFRFAWTQGASRTRWTVIRLALLGAAVTGLALAFAGVFTWWYGPWTAIDGRLSNSIGAYEVSGLVFAARTLFTLMLGAFLGALIRRTVAAMGATLLVSVGAVLASARWLRSHIEKPILAVISSAHPVSGAAPPRLADKPTAWIISQWTTNAAGAHLTSAQVRSVMQQAAATLFGSGPAGPGRGPVKVAPDSRGPLQSYFTQHGFTQWATFEPGSRFWHFQGVEAAAYVLVALLLAGATVWLVRRRRA
ncbi:MAG TPA: hypothetical protein VFW71_03985 [Actinomycetota bacterium]|nr:hypothetical protein [Actinomycetota bacterium]